MEHDVKVIARIYNDFTEKFGIPRQSGILEELSSTIVFEPEYRREEALRGIEGFSHLWLIWQFSEAIRENWSPTVRPPRLGGNKRVGVFATRSPYRPNPIGLSCVELVECVKTSDNGTVLVVKGADLMSGTPIYDIKPYLPFSDLKPNATSGFTESIDKKPLEVVISQELVSMLPEEKVSTLIKLLQEDPRPSYQNDNCRIYGFAFSSYEIKFTVTDDKYLQVIDIEKTDI